MADFLQRLDRVYCLCIESRKAFVVEHFRQLGMLHKLEIVTAYTPTSDIVQQVLEKQLIYPVYTKNPTTIACGMGVRYIMQQIVEKSYKHAMVMEDDVIFPEELFPVANEWICPEMINRSFNTSLPYVLYLQSSVKEETYGNLRGIVRKDVRYGEPAYVTNDVACRILLNEFFPVTSPFDEYKIEIRKKYGFQVGIVIPYICRELSANYNKFDLGRLPINTTFVRTGHVDKSDILTRMVRYPVHANYSNYPLFPEVLGALGTGTVRYTRVATDQPSDDTMVYDIGGCLRQVKGYLVGSTIHPSKALVKPFYAIGVRGENSQKILQYHGVKTFVFDFGWLFHLAYPSAQPGEGTIVLTRGTHPETIDVSTLNLQTILDLIQRHRTIITDQIDLLSIAHGYSKSVLFAVKNPEEVNQETLLMIQDYHSNFYQTPHELITFDQARANQISQYPPIPKVLINNAAQISPFRLDLHRLYQKFHTQAVRGTQVQEPKILTDDRSVIFSSTERRLYIGTPDLRKDGHHFTGIDVYLREHLVGRFDFLDVTQLMSADLTPYQLVIVNAAVFSPPVDRVTTDLSAAILRLSQIPKVVLLAHDMHDYSFVRKAAPMYTKMIVSGDTVVVCGPDLRMTLFKKMIVKHFNKYQFRHLISIYDCPEYTNLREILTQNRVVENYYQINHIIPHSIFRPEPSEKIYDVISYGASGHQYYRLRTVIKKVCEGLGIRYRAIAPTEGIREESLTSVINQSWMAICCSSNYSYMVRRYLEISACNCVVLADTNPQTWSILGNNMVCVTIDDSEDVIGEKIKYYLRHKEILASLSSRSIDSVAKESYSTHAQRLAEISDHILRGEPTDLLAPKKYIDPAPRQHSSSVVELAGSQTSPSIHTYKTVPKGHYVVVHPGRPGQLVYRDSANRVLNKPERTQYDPSEDKTYFSIHLSEDGLVTVEPAASQGIFYSISE